MQIHTESRQKQEQKAMKYYNLKTDKEEIKAYIKQKILEKSAQRIITAADKILKAGA